MDGSTDLREYGRNHRGEILGHVGQTGMTVFGMVSLLAGVGVILRWNHLRADVLSQPAALIGLVTGVLTVLVWIAFTLRRVTATRIGAVVAAVGALAGAGLYAGSGAYAGSTHEPSSAPPLAVALILVPYLAFLAIAFRAVDLPRVDARDTTLPAMRWPVALPFQVLTYGLGFAGLWATLNDGSQLLAGRPIVVLHYGTAALGFSMLGVLRARATAAFAALAGAVAVAIYLPVEAGSLLIPAGTSSTGALSCLVLMLALVPAMLWLAHHRAATTPARATVEV